MRPPQTRGYQSYAPSNSPHHAYIRSSPIRPDGSHAGFAHGTTPTFRSVNPEYQSNSRGFHSSTNPLLRSYHLQQARSPAPVPQSTSIVPHFEPQVYSTNAYAAPTAAAPVSRERGDHRRSRRTKHRSSRRSPDVTSAQIDALRGKDPQFASKRSHGAHKHRYASRPVSQVRRPSVDSWDAWDNASSPSFLATHKRAGPCKEEEDDSLNIRDLFPCFGDVFDACGCAKKRRKRAAMPKAAPAGPKVETMCLECGHVLNQRHLPLSMQRDLADNYDWRNLNGPRDPRLQEVAGEFMDQYDREGKAPKFHGYNGWTYHDGPRFNAEEFKPQLPQFGTAPAREFGQRPGDYQVSGAQDNEFFDVEQNGLVALPQFQAGSVAGSN